MKRILLFSILISPFVHAQDLTGTWEGRGNWSGANYIKLVLVKCNGQYIGYSYDSGPGFCQANFAGDFNESIRSLRGENKGMIRKTFEHIQSRFDMIYKKESSGEYLVGQVRAKSAFTQILSFGLTETIRLRRISKVPDDTTEYMKACLVRNEKRKTDTLKSPNNIIVLKQASAEKKIDSIQSRTPPPPLATRTNPSIKEIRSERTNDTVATIQTKESLIQISVYDNGQIDGDTITVFHNNQLIADKIGVSAIPYKFSIQVDKNHPVHDIVFVANNLGSIPPNTAVLVIETGDKKYNLFASSDLKKNSVVIFRFEDR